ncbi:BLOC-1-related complex subunit 8 homolog [Thrips palmi]|uniref:BLOC-1-related complex subunit 8 homolog n=1 Tax=Thrips palmi TaxID=161013 RepID=A0A6P8YW92_THRPL|nr:BLOC-1-related complex subunit 8 homolog [Thrips palmi]XP_034241526.1 BLOC-1-related complex subunit 8 homolog [Thrips palmi]
MSSLPLDPELESRIKKGTEKISENMHIVANEPSLAFYRLQEHVRKSLPPMVEKRVEVVQLNHDLQGCLYDVEYGVSAVKSIEKAEESFSNIKELMKNALIFKQQLRQEEMKRGKKELTSSSVYRRLSAHISLADYSSK